MTDSEFTHRSTFHEIIYEKKDWVAAVTINRSKVYNAFSLRTLQELGEAFRDAAFDDSVAVVVLTGAGERAFCTGADVKEYAREYTHRPREYWKYIAQMGECLNRLRHIGKPTIARINGIVAGGGNELNLTCDLAIMAEHASIRQVGTRVGSVAALGATQWLPIVVGDRRAREILWLCEEIEAQKCLDWGLVNQVVPSVRGADGNYLNLTGAGEVKAALEDPANRIDLTALDEAVLLMCQKLIDKFPECLRYTQQQTNFWKDFAWTMTMGHAQDWLALHFACLEPYEGMTAFVEKRPPDYRGLRERAAQGGSSEFLWGSYRRTCPRCGAKGLPEEFRFCGRCGAALE
ncbi:MAG: enoyl-CoA hydratase/isomerase family protein [Acidobacteria bacterium]|nr:enoyl-CoA hydratase/isomerase family protein [Acidobacteriota bacterium]